MRVPERNSDAGLTDQERLLPEPWEIVSYVRARRCWIALFRVSMVRQLSAQPIVDMVPSHGEDFRRDQSLLQFAHRRRAADLAVPVGRKPRTRTEEQIRCTTAYSTIFSFQRVSGWLPRFGRDKAVL